MFCHPATVNTYHSVDDSVKGKSVKFSIPIDISLECSFSTYFQLMQSGEEVGNAVSTNIFSPP